MNEEQHKWAHDQIGKEIQGQEISGIASEGSHGNGVWFIVSPAGEEPVRRKYRGYPKALRQNRTTPEPLVDIPKGTPVNMGQHSVGSNAAELNGDITYSNGIRRDPVVKAYLENNEIFAGDPYSAAMSVIVTALDLANGEWGHAMSEDESDILARVKNTVRFEDPAAIGS